MVSVSGGGGRDKWFRRVFRNSSAFMPEAVLDQVDPNDPMFTGDRIESTDDFRGPRCRRGRSLPFR